jgi:hypothetical protein
MSKKYVNKGVPPAAVVAHWLRTRHYMMKVSKKGSFDDVEDFEIAMEQISERKWQVSVRCMDGEQDLMFVNDYTYTRGKWKCHPLRCIVNGVEKTGLGNDILSVLNKLFGGDKSKTAAAAVGSSDTAGSGFGSAEQRRAAVVRN